MSVLNPRSRLLSFRVSEKEYNSIESALSRSEARSVSDFARQKVLGSINGSSYNSQLESKIRKIAREVVEEALNEDPRLDSGLRVG